MIHPGCGCEPATQAVGTSNHLSMDLKDIARIVSTWAKGKPLINRVYLFGSRVRGDHDPQSDIDIAVELDPNEFQGSDETGGLATWMFETNGWKGELQKLLPVRVQLERYQQEQTHTVRRGLAESSVLIYEKGPLISWVPKDDPTLLELRKRDASLIPLLEGRNSAAVMLEALPERFTPEQVSTESNERRCWEIVGLLHLNTGRVSEALALFWGLYQQMLLAQRKGQYVHKGLPLVWIAECFARLNSPVHAKRYLMLTLCEDALREKGSVSPNNTGIYFRLVWGGLPDQELRRYAVAFYRTAQEHPEDALFPEALLQRLDQKWITEFPSAHEASAYWVNPVYVSHLLKQLGDGKGHALEVLAEYLMSCMPGCRTMRRKPSWSTDYDIVCSMDGFDLDFRSELGRYFVCECKDWQTPASFTVMAKFCRVLDSTKSRFGVLFSKSGISGAGRTEYAEREQLKVFQDRGMVIVVLDLNDLEAVANGANLIQLLRERYEAVRLDSPASSRPN